MERGKKERRMKVLTFRVAIIMMMVCLGNHANATLITDFSEQDWAASGDKALTYDRSTGLEWLDLSYTQGKSILETEAQSFFGDFRWATAAEVNNIFDTVIVGSGTRFSYLAEHYALALRFNGLFASQGQGIIRESLSGRGNSRGSVYADSVNLRAIVSDMQWDRQWGVTTRVSNVGAWLVRDHIKVPEPSTLAIFALGMIGLASRRFKKQS